MTMTTGMVEALLLDVSIMIRPGVGLVAAAAAVVTESTRRLRAVVLVPLLAPPAEHMTMITPLPDSRVATAIGIESTAEAIGE